MPNLEQFKQELKELLIRHDVVLGFELDDGSDTYGIYGEKMVVEHQGQVVFSVRGWELTARDL